MLHVVPGRTGARAVPLSDDAPWRNDLAALDTLLQASRSRGPSRAEIAALIEAEAPGALSPAARARIAGRLADLMD
ncbi:hypothetical protein NS228_13700 [Methylobacterium indicum]|uniref:hypothetical protein n=1 Tax=Methylobacterium indicum TaxID=1775910 RepID=UPI000733D6A2|nr:hypothetical protein [Methylobacterium indicum]KTS37971.1 hypothetical protein NS229_05015 [Methylobacterium indicum]KTS39834.1 hypothetical protein NS228_13700 [Methylobacterium indicum]KTS54609.1 hypothetical protein NS230_00945 [Methylobacterium indicum]